MDSEHFDTIAVREDEQLHIPRLEDYLRAVSAELGIEPEPFTLRQFGGGMANLTYELTFKKAKRQFVLRRPPLGPVAASAHDMGREYKVLSQLYRAFPLAPRAYHYCEDLAVIGAPFFVMERRHGVVVRRKMPAAFQADPEAGRRFIFLQPVGNPLHCGIGRIIRQSGFFPPPVPALNLSGDVTGRFS